MNYPCTTCGQYKTSSLAVDGIVHDNNKILLIKRNKETEPFFNAFSLPGGFVDYGEELEKAVIREVWEETGLKTEINQLIGVYSKPQRDPRRHIVSTAFSLQVVSGELKTSNESTTVGWHDLDALPQLAFDHAEMIQDFRQHNRIFGNYHGWDLGKKLVFCSHSRHYMHASLLICKFVIDKACVPINSFTNFGYFLYELVPRHDIAESINNIINRCDEQWVFGPITEGVRLEIEMCRSMGKPIKFFEIVENEHPVLIKETTEDKLQLDTHNTLLQ